MTNKYTDFLEIFLCELIAQLLEYIGIQNYTIKFTDN